MKKIKFAILIAVVLTCAFVFAACGEGGEQKAVFKSFAAAFNACYEDGFKDADMEKVAEAFGPSGKEYNDALSKIKALKSDAAKKGEKVKLTVLSYSGWEITEKAATVTIKVRVVETEPGSKDKTNTEEKKVEFRKVGDVWYFDGSLSFTFFK